MDSTTVVTILSVPAILAVVNLLKGLGLPSKWAALTAVVVATLFGVAAYYLGGNPAFAFTAQAFLLGLAAAGLYDVTKSEAAPEPVAPLYDVTKSE